MVRACTYVYAPRNFLPPPDEKPELQNLSFSLASSYAHAREYVCAYNTRARALYGRRAPSSERGREEE